MNKASSEEKRFYEIARYIIKDCEIAYDVGQVSSNRRQREIHLKCIENNVFLKEIDKVKMKLSLEEQQKVELKNLFNKVRQLLNTENIISLSDITKEGLIFIEYNVKNINQLTTYNINNDILYERKYLTVKNKIS